MKTALLLAGVGLAALVLSFAPAKADEDDDKKVVGAIAAAPTLCKIDVKGSWAQGVTYIMQETNGWSDRQLDQIKAKYRDYWIKHRRADAPVMCQLVKTIRAELAQD